MFSRQSGKSHSSEGGQLKKALAQRSARADKSAVPNYLQSENLSTNSTKKAHEKQAVDKNTEQLIEQQRGNGKPLPEQTRELFENKLGADLSATKVHTGAKAQSAAERLSARAFTVGKDIYFAEGEYSPDSVAGKKLLAHELAHVVQQQGGKADVQEKVQRDYINDGTGNPIAYEFRPGTELQPAFVALAKRLAADGSISDNDLRRLRQSALQQRGTLNDHERLFMAGLLAAANVAILNVSNAGDSFQFATGSITRARREHVNNLDRELPADVQAQVTEFEQAWDSGDAIGVMNELGDIERASARAILRDAGSFREQAQALLDFINGNSISATEVLRAMINSASDNSRGDRVLAGTVYAIVRQAGNPMASRLLGGSVKVDALIPGALAALPGFSGAEEAAYITTAQVGGAKGDTIYVKTDLNIEDLHQRSVVIHELQHASDDAAASATARPQFPVRAQLEANAYRAQARYIYTQLNVLAPADQVTGAQNVAFGMNSPLAVALVREALANTARDRPVFELINGSMPSGRLSTAQINGAFGLSASVLDTRLLRVISALYGFSTSEPGVVDGLAGESSMDWIFRL
ncbi:protein of unknown function [Alteromonadaceae bacterium Bs31]|nr:protein of unknown function [Alteromonadaceae bacterium Bs31]